MPCGMQGTLHSRRSTRYTPCCHLIPCYIAPLVHSQPHCTAPATLRSTCHIADRCLLLWLQQLVDYTTWCSIAALWRGVVAVLLGGLHRWAPLVSGVVICCRASGAALDGGVSLTFLGARVDHWWCVVARLPFAMPMSQVLSGCMAPRISF